MPAAKRPDVGVVIAGGGAGRRFGGRLPKQFLRLGDRTILEYSIAAFQAVAAVRQIVVVAPAAHLRRTERLVRRADFSKVVAVIAGGKHRQDSVRRGLTAFHRTPAVVLVHDAARPLVSRSIIQGVIAGAVRYGAAVVGTRVSDTIKIERRKGFSTATLDRSRLWTVQTPQGFRYPLLVKAHRAAAHAGFTGTDESSLAERIGIPVRLVAGDRRNVKITTWEDLRIARTTAR